MDRRNAMSGMAAGLAMGLTPWPASGRTSRTPTGYLRTNWSRDPFSFGSYSYLAKGARRQDIRELERPVAERLFFAGEAVFPDRNSTVHAAYESGLRTAAALLATSAKRIGVIGAGVSGLAAAHRLATNGKEVVVFEARDRIGGRVWTDRRRGPPLDLGASWIHGVDGNPVAELAAALGVTTTPTDDAFLIRGKGGRLVSDAEAPGWLENVVSVQHRAGADGSQINNWAYWGYDDYGGRDVVFPDGYAQILGAFEAAYETRLGDAITRVRRGDATVRLETASGVEQAFDAVICTLPLGVLKARSVVFDPPLPKRKRLAIDRLGMGVLDKVYLQYDQPFWDQDATWIVTPDTELPRGQFNQWLNLYRYLGTPIILAFNGGPPARALAALSDKGVVSRAIQTLDRVYPS